MCKNSSQVIEHKTYSSSQSLLQLPVPHHMSQLVGMSCFALCFNMMPSNKAAKEERKDSLILFYKF